MCLPILLFFSPILMAQWVLKGLCMQPITTFPVQPMFRSIPVNFWERVLTDEQLRECSDLEKLLAGCEIIAAFDDLDELLAA